MLWHNPVIDLLERKLARFSSWIWKKRWSGKTRELRFQIKKAPK
jgi:hypothetical protein